MSKRILIVEDELVIAENTKLLILQLYPTSKIEVAGSSDEAITLLESFLPTITLVDIRLGDGTDGIEFSKTLAEKNLPFIFITAHGDVKTISAAVENKPLAYLIKPVSKQELYANLELAFSKNIAEKYFVFRDGTHDIRIPQHEIIYLKADGHYTEIHTMQKRYVLRRSMKSILNDLNVELIQSHRSYFVNPEYIRETNALVYLSNGIELPLSRNFKPTMLEKLFKV